MLNVAYSASVVEREISECNLVFQKRGTLLRKMIKVPQDIGDEVHLELNVLNRLKISHKVRSHLLHTVGKQYMRDV